MLDERIEAIRKEYGLAKEDFWELPQKKGTWLVKHSALEIVAAKAGIVFDPPTVLEAHSADGLAVLCVTGRTPNRSVWSIGEASPKNSKNAYPWAMAEKRAIDRVILKLVGIHGLVYSEDEMSDAEPPKPLPKKAARPLEQEMRDELDSCQSVEDMDILVRSPAWKVEFAKLPADWQEQLREYYAERRTELTPVSRTKAPNFDNLEPANG